MGHFYFARHGETVWNVENKICGATESPLTQQGRKQAEQLGQKIIDEQIHIDKIICSPLSRAEDTARIISEMISVPCQTIDALVEQNFGRYESTPRDGKEFAEAKTRFIDSYGDGESMLKTAHRIYTVIDEIVKDHESVYLIVAHNGLARIVNSYFHDMTNEEFASFGIRNCDIIRFDF